MTIGLIVLKYEHNFQTKKMKKKHLFVILLALVVTSSVLSLLIVKMGSLNLENKQKTEDQKKVTNGNSMKSAPDSGDTLFHLGDGYFYFGNNGYYYGKLIEGADGSELENLGLGYAKDNKKVFFQGIEIENADAETFKERERFVPIFSDKNHGYYDGKRLTLSEADELGEFLSKGIGGKDLGNNYREYNGRIYYWDTAGGQAVASMVPVDANLETFVSVDNSYCQWNRTITKYDPCRRFGKDDKKVFYESFELEDADPATFQILEGMFTKDKNYVFYDTQKVEGIDSGTFQTMGMGQYGKDDSIVIYRNTKIGGADPQTFEVLHEEYCIAYANSLARDKEGYYSHELKITKDEFDKFVKSTGDSCFSENEKWNISPKWKLVSGNPSDSCSRPTYSGDVEIRGWYEWGSNYTSKEWLLHVDKRDVTKLIDGYAGLYSLRNVPDSLVAKLKKANDKNPVTIKIKSLAYYCEGLPWLEMQ